MHPNGSKPTEKIFIRIIDDKELQELIVENKQLKQQIEDMKIKNVSEDVYLLWKTWNNQPVPKNLTLEDDARNFAQSITKFIFSKLQN